MIWILNNTTKIILIIILVTKHMMIMEIKKEIHIIFVVI